MRHLIKSPKLLLFSIGSVLLYTALSVALPSRFLLELMNGVFLGIVAAVTVVFFPLFLRALRTRQFDGISQLTMGIILTWFALIGSRVLSSYINATGEAARIAASPIIGFFAYLAILGGVLHVTAPGMVENEWKYNRRILFVGVAFGTAVAGLTIFLQQRGFVGWL